MSEPMIVIRALVDEKAKRIIVEKNSSRSYVVTAPRELSAMEALAEVARVDPDGSRRRGE